MGNSNPKYYSRKDALQIVGSTEWTKLRKQLGHPVVSKIDFSMFTLAIQTSFENVSQPMCAMLYQAFSLDTSTAIDIQRFISSLAVLNGNDRVLLLRFLFRVYEKHTPAVAPGYATVPAGYVARRRLEKFLVMVYDKSMDKEIVNMKLNSLFQMDPTECSREDIDAATLTLAEFEAMPGPISILTYWVQLILVQSFVEPLPLRLEQLERRYSVRNEVYDFKTRFKDFPRAAELCDHLRHVFYNHCIIGKQKSKSAECTISTWLAWTWDYISPTLALTLFNSSLSEMKSVWRFADFAEFCMTFGAMNLEARASTVCTAFLLRFCLQTAAQARMHRPHHTFENRLQADTLAAAQQKKAYMRKMILLLAQTYTAPEALPVDRLHASGDHQPPESSCNDMLDNGSPVKIGVNGLTRNVSAGSFTHGFDMESDMDMLDGYSESSSRCGTPTKGRVSRANSTVPSTISNSSLRGATGPMIPECVSVNANVTNIIVANHVLCRELSQFDRLILASGSSDTTGTTGTNSIQDSSIAISIGNELNSLHGLHEEHSSFPYDAQHRETSSNSKEPTGVTGHGAGGDWLRGTRDAYDKAALPLHSSSQEDTSALPCTLPRHIREKLLNIESESDPSVQLYIDLIKVHSEAFPALKALSMLSCCHFGMQPGTHQLQNQYATELMLRHCVVNDREYDRKHPFGDIGSEWCVINKSWWQQWQLYVGQGQGNHFIQLRSQQQDGSDIEVRVGQPPHARKSKKSGNTPISIPPGPPLKPPGPIDNSSILSNHPWNSIIPASGSSSAAMYSNSDSAAHQNSTCLQLKADLITGQHIEAIPLSLYNTLVAWYGAVTPPIVRTVVAIPVESTAATTGTRSRSSSASSVSDSVNNSYSEYANASSTALPPLSPSKPIGKNIPATTRSMLDMYPICVHVAMCDALGKHVPLYSATTNNDEAMLFSRSKSIAQIIDVVKFRRNIRRPVRVWNCFQSVLSFWKNQYWVDEELLLSDIPRLDSDPTDRTSLSDIATWMTDGVINTNDGDHLLRVVFMFEICGEDGSWPRTQRQEELLTLQRQMNAYNNDEEDNANGATLDSDDECDADEDTCNCCNATDQQLLALAIGGGDGVLGAAASDDVLSTPALASSAESHEMEKQTNDNPQPTAGDTLDTHCAAGGESPAAAAYLKEPIGVARPSIITSRSAISSTTGRKRSKVPRRLKLNDGNIGLTNLGNTCYLNSSLQALFHTQSLMEYFLTKSDTHGFKYHYMTELNVKNIHGHSGKLATAFAQLAKECWTASNTSVLSPRNFRLVLGKIRQEFAGKEQQDAQELLTFLLDGLSEDLNQVQVKPYTTQPDSDTLDKDGHPLTDSQLADIWWRNHLQRDHSIIQDIFLGQFKSTVRCPTCRYTSSTFEPFSILSVPLPEDHLRSILVHIVPSLRYNTSTKTTPLDGCSSSGSYGSKVGSNTRIIQCCVRVPIDGSISDVVSALRVILYGGSDVTENSKVASSSNLAASKDDSISDGTGYSFEISEYCKRRVVRFFPNSMKLKKLADNVCVYAFELPVNHPASGVSLLVGPRRQSAFASVPRPIASPPTSIPSTPFDPTPKVRVVFCQRRIRRISVFGSSAGSGLDFHTGGLDKFIVEPFGRPLMLILPKTITAHELYETVSENVKHFLKSPIQDVSAVIDMSILGSPVDQDYDQDSIQGEELPDTSSYGIPTDEQLSLHASIHPTLPPATTANTAGSESSARVSNSGLPAVSIVSNESVFAGTINPYGFTLRFVNSDNNQCSRCSWLSGCVGCGINPPNDTDVSPTNPVELAQVETLSIDWHLTVYEESLDMAVANGNMKKHSSMKNNYKLKDRSVSLNSCIRSFTEEENLDEVYLCPKCKGKCPPTEDDCESSVSGTIKDPEAECSGEKSSSVIGGDDDVSGSNRAVDGECVSDNSPHTPTASATTMSTMAGIPTRQTSDQLDHTHRLHDRSEIQKEKAIATPTLPVIPLRKCIQLWRCPPVLVVQVKRFQFDHLSRRKLTGKLKFPMYDLDLSEFVVHNENSSDTRANSAECSYDLYAVIHHTGALNGGHYTTMAKEIIRTNAGPSDADSGNPVGQSGGNSTVSGESIYSTSASPVTATGSTSSHHLRQLQARSMAKWYCYNDNHVNKVSPQAVGASSSSAYVLFYMRSDLLTDSDPNSFWSKSPVPTTGNDQGPVKHAHNKTAGKSRSATGEVISGNGAAGKSSTSGSTAQSRDLHPGGKPSQSAPVGGAPVSKYYQELSPSTHDDSKDACTIH